MPDPPAPRERSHALVFCPGCHDGGSSHTKTYRSTGADGYPSSLAIQLRSERWLPCTLDGEPLETLSKPESAWWLAKPPSGAALRQSPWRLVPLCGVEGVDESLRSLVGLNNLYGASADVVERLLLDLRERFPEGPSTSGGIRQAFVGLHRLAYERLSELAASGTPIADVMARTSVLCELGDSLKYCRLDEARHDDGRFTAYIRHFVGHIPFAILPKDRASVARQLGVAPFRLELKRLGEDAGRDVTDEARAFHGDRIAELLAIMVHHSLGAQTPEVTSDEFEARVHRIRNLKIMQLDDLVVDAAAEGSDFRARIGEGSDRDLFLENPASTAPILFHDFSGDDWRDRLRQKRVDKELANNPSAPPVLHDDVQRLFGPDLAQLIKGNLLATVNAPAPDRDRLVEWSGVSAERLERVQRALERPQRERIRRLKGDMDHLRERKVLPAVPEEFQPLRQPTKRPEPEPGPRPVRQVKIDEKHDQRKRELGNEGERWALAAVIRALTELNEKEDRDNAINKIEALLREQFEGEVVEKALGHAATARNLDDEERIEALSGLLHVSQHSDAFGFDMIGWLPTGSGGKSQAVCLEVKSSEGEGFHFSLGEWSVAEKLHNEGKGTPVRSTRRPSREIRGHPQPHGSPTRPGETS